MREYGIFCWAFCCWWNEQSVLFLGGSFLVGEFMAAEFVLLVQRVSLHFIRKLTGKKVNGSCIFKRLCLSLSNISVAVLNLKLFLYHYELLINPLTSTASTLDSFQAFGSWCTLRITWSFEKNAAL